MAVTIKKRPAGELSNAELSKRKNIDEFGIDLESLSDHKPAIRYKLPERVFKTDLMLVFEVSLSALNVRIRRHEIPPAEGKDGRRQWWHAATIQALYDESRMERAKRIEAARVESRKRAAVNRRSPPKRAIKVA